MGGIAAAVAVITLFWSIGAQFADDEGYHYGDCGGKGAMPPKGKRGVGYIPLPDEKKRVIYDFADYVYAEGRVACPNGEKVTGYVELWNDDKVERYKEDTKANGGRCGPKARITMGYFEVDGYMRDSGTSINRRGWIAPAEPYLWFNINCEGLGEFRLKKCLKCPNHVIPADDKNPEEPDWTSENTGLVVVLPNTNTPGTSVGIDIGILCRQCHAVKAS